MRFVLDMPSLRVSVVVSHFCSLDFSFACTDQFQNGEIFEEAQQAENALEDDAREQEEDHQRRQKFETGEEVPPQSEEHCSTEEEYEHLPEEQAGAEEEVRSRSSRCAHG